MTRLFHKQRIRISQNAHLPLDAKMRIEAEYRNHLQFIPMYVTVAIIELCAILTLLFDGVIAGLVSEIIYQHTTYIGNLFLYAFILLTMLVCLANYQILKPLHKFLQFHMYTHLYTTCRYVTPDEKRRLCIPQVLLRYHIHFDYVFDESKIIYLIKNKHAAQNTLELEAENVVESTVAVQPLYDTPVLELPSGEVLREIPIDVSQKQSMEIHHIESKNHKQAISLYNASSVETRLEQKQNIENSEQTQTGQCHLLISMGRSVSFVLKGERTKERVDVPMYTYYTAILTYLALHPEEDARKHTTIIKSIYGGVGKKEKDLFNKHTLRIRELIRKSLTEKFMYTLPDQKLHEPQPFDPFEQVFVSKGDSRWYLSSFCHVAGTTTLSNLYTQLKAKDSFTPKLERVELHKRLRRLREIYSGHYLDKHSNEEEYSGGYLVEHLQEDAFKRWMPVFFHEYRTQYIYILEHVAEYECRLAPKVQNDEGNQIAAELYKECAYAASCHPIDQQSGERTLRKCIDMYMLVNDDDAAIAVCNTYAKRVKKVLSVWVPEQETQKQLEKYSIEVKEHFEIA